MKNDNELLNSDTVIESEKEKRFREFKLKLYGENGLTPEKREYIRRILIEPSRLVIK